MKQNSKILKGSHLKITPQRLAILEAVKQLNHPTAEEVTELIRKNHPHIATGTVYKTLDTFVGSGIIKRVKTDSDLMRYDGTLNGHHHLYCAETERIEDYIDAELTSLLSNFFEQKGIPGFEIQDIKLQITGKFTHS